MKKSFLDFKNPDETPDTHALSLKFEKRAGKFNVKGSFVLKNSTAIYLRTSTK